MVGRAQAFSVRCPCRTYCNTNGNPCGPSARLNGATLHGCCPVMTWSDPDGALGVEPGAVCGVVCIDLIGSSFAEGELFFFYVRAVEIRMRDCPAFAHECTRELD